MFVPIGTVSHHFTEPVATIAGQALGPSYSFEASFEAVGMKPRKESITGRLFA